MYDLRKPKYINELVLLVKEERMPFLLDGRWYIAKDVLFDASNCSVTINTIDNNSFTLYFKDKEIEMGYKLEDFELLYLKEDTITEIILKIKEKIKREELIKGEEFSNIERINIMCNFLCENKNLTFSGSEIKRILKDIGISEICDISENTKSVNKATEEDIRLLIEGFREVMSLLHLMYKPKKETEIIMFLNALDGFEQMVFTGEQVKKMIEEVGKC